MKQYICFDVDHPVINIGSQCPCGCGGFVNLMDLEQWVYRGCKDGDEKSLPDTFCEVELRAFELTREGTTRVPV